MICQIFLVYYIIFSFFVISFCHELNSSNLVALQVLFRHGERSPSRTYSNDPHKDHLWPGGWDQLSNNGKNEMYELGRNLKELYKNVLNETYNPNAVYVLSSYADRCHMSAQLLLAGLYPPVKLQVWNPELLWQPIPVHEIPRHLDNKIALKKACPKYEIALKDAYSSEKMKEINEENRELFDYLSLHTGDEIRNIRTVETLYNTLKIQQINNLKLPDWTANVFPHKMKKLAGLSLAIFTDTQFMKRMHGGMLVKDIVSNMRNAIENKPALGVFLYSGHDLTVVSLLNCLGIEEITLPEFGASVYFELHNINDEHFVKILFKDTPFSDMRELELKDCKHPCKFNVFREVLASVMPDNWEKECEMK